MGKKKANSREKLSVRNKYLDSKNNAAAPLIPSPVLDELNPFPVSTGWSPTYRDQNFLKPHNLILYISKYNANLNIAVFVFLVAVDYLNSQRKLQMVCDFRNTVAAYTRADFMTKFLSGGNGLVGNSPGWPRHLIKKITILDTTDGWTDTTIRDYFRDNSIDYSLGDPQAVDNSAVTLMNHFGDYSNYRWINTSQRYWVSWGDPALYLTDPKTAIKRMVLEQTELESIYEDDSKPYETLMDEFTVKAGFYLSFYGSLSTWIPWNYVIDTTFSNKLWAEFPVSQLSVIVLNPNAASDATTEARNEQLEQLPIIGGIFKSAKTTTRWEMKALYPLAGQVMYENAAMIQPSPPLEPLCASAQSLWRSQGIQCLVYPWDQVPEIMETQDALGAIPTITLELIIMAFTGQPITQEQRKDIYNVLRKISPSEELFDRAVAFMNGQRDPYHASPFSGRSPGPQYRGGS